MIPALMDDFERFKTSGEDVTADAVEIAGELELGVEPEDGIELLHLRIKQRRNCTLWMSEECGFFLEIESITNEDAVKMLK